MNMDIEEELGIRDLRAVFVRYTREAFMRLPRIEGAKILDVGCGSGSALFELTALSGGELTGVDVDAFALERLKERMESEGISGRNRQFALQQSQ